MHSLGHQFLETGMGLSLRFPRFIRQREDKNFRLPLHLFLDALVDEDSTLDDTEVGTSVEEILTMYDYEKFSGILLDDKSKKQ